MAEGNALLPAFIADYNARFAKAPANTKDLHRPLRAGDDLDDAFAWKEERTLSQALTLQYDKILFIVEPTDQAKAAIGKRVTVVDYPDGRLAIRYRGVELAYRTFDKIRQVSQAAIVENKQLGAALAFIREEQLRREPERRSRATPPRSARRPSLQGWLSLLASGETLDRRSGIKRILRSLTHKRGLQPPRGKERVLYEAIRFSTDRRCVSD